VQTADVCYFDAGQNVMPNLNYYHFVPFIQAATPIRRQSREKMVSTEKIGLCLVG
jgi:hypothetical protein